MTGHPVLSIRLLVAAGAVATTSAAVLAVGAIAERGSRHALTAEVEARLVLEARNLATTSAGALLNDFPELVLHPLVRDLEQQSHELAFVVVVDHEGRVQGHRESRLLGTPYEAPAGLQTHVALRPLPGGEMLENDELLVARAPVVSRDGTSLGTVVVGLRRDHVENVLAAARRRQILVVSAVLVTAALAALALMTWVLRPVGVLRKGLERIGQGDLDSPLALRNRTELGVLADAVDEMAGKLRAARAETAEKERLAREVELARDIQESLLPRTETTAGSFRIRGHQRAAAEVGGDYFDYFPLPGGRIGIAVADVAGKGLGGCLVMSMLSALLRAFKDSYRSPSDLLVRLDERLSERLMPGTFVTMFYGILDPSSGNLIFASAGHCTPLIYRAEGRVEAVVTRGIPLGAVRGGAIRRTLADHTVRLGAGDMLLQYTDGINEAFDPAGREQFGVERMERAIAQAASRGSRAVLDGLWSELDRWVAGGTRLDDETLLVVSREIEVETAAEPLAPAFSAGSWIARARALGEGLWIPAAPEELQRIHAWTASHPEFGTLETHARSLLDTALYEAVANIMEHGYGTDPEKGLHLWWLPATALGPLAAEIHDAGGSDRLGAFLLLDHGQPFRAENWQATDFGDPDVRRRGRGFGLDIIHRTMTHVQYHPGTPEGNLTLLAFDPALLESERSQRYA